MLNELDEITQEVFLKYKSALNYIGVDFFREDVQEALINSACGMEAALQATLDYWVWKRQHNQILEYPSACLIKALSEQWAPIGWKDEYLNNPEFKSLCQLWWEKAAEVWGANLRNLLVADVTETPTGYTYILFTSGKTLSLKIAQVWGWQRVLDYAQSD